MALTDKIKAIADAIRTKTGSTDVMTLDEMPNKIINIPSVKEPYVEETYNEDGEIIAAKFVGHTKVRDYAFENCLDLVLAELPAGITTIGFRAFYNCQKLVLTEIPSSITTIGNHAFNNCESLTSIRFLGTPNSIGRYAFYDCDNLTSIKVPWSEGAVKNAPWGATNATIEYDYTGE